MHRLKFIFYIIFFLGFCFNTFSADIKRTEAFNSYENFVEESSAWITIPTSLGNWHKEIIQRGFKLISVNKINDDEFDGEDFFYFCKDCESFENMYQCSSGFIKNDDLTSTLLKPILRCRFR